jgi:hypothetical protein
VLGDPRDCVNGFYAYAVPYYCVVPPERAQAGAYVWIVETRRAPNTAIDQTVKNFNRMDLTKGTFEAPTMVLMPRFCCGEVPHGGYDDIKGAIAIAAQPNSVPAEIVAGRRYRARQIFRHFTGRDNRRHSLIFLSTRLMPELEPSSLFFL